MILINVLCVALALTGQALAAIADPTRDAKESVKGYIVTLKDSASKEATLSQLRSARRASGLADIKVEEWDVIHGFSGMFLRRASLV
jgi:uncharacterized protein YdbL (DUF1318 family)